MELLLPFHPICEVSFMNVQLVQFNRTSISIKDLDQAIKYLIRLNEILVNSSDFEVRSALLVAAIISYLVAVLW